MKKRAFSLLELLIIILILSVMAGISLPLFGKTRERAFDSEAVANLKLIQAAERIYQIETGEYLTCGDIDCANANLKLTLPAGAARKWDYTTAAFASPPTFTARAARFSPPAGYARTWSMDQNDDEPACAGAGCPPP